MRKSIHKSRSNATAPAPAQVETRTPPPMPAAPDILESAAMHIAERGKTRDIPGGERSMRRTIEAFNALCGHILTERDGWMFMAILKASRAATGALNLDDYEDGAAYFALAGECAARRASP